MTDSQEPGVEIVPLQSGQTLIHRGGHRLSLGLTRDFRDLLDRLMDRRIFDVQSHRGTFLPLQWYHCTFTRAVHRSSGFRMDCAHHVARLNEACPLRLAWTNRAVGHSIVAYHETGSDESHSPASGWYPQPGEFDNLPCRTVREALKHPVTDPRVSAVDTGDQVQLGNPQSSLALNHLLLEATLPALRPPPAPYVGKGLENTHCVGGLPRSHRLSWDVNVNAAFGDVAEGQPCDTTAGQHVHQCGSMPCLAEVPPQRPQPKSSIGVDNRDKVAQRVSVAGQ